MKKIIPKILFIALILTITVGCEKDKKIEVQREVVQTRYTAAHTDMRVQNIVINGAVSPILIPYFQDEIYEVQLVITYDDGSTMTKWTEISRDEYEVYRDMETYSD